MDKFGGDIYLDLGQNETSIDDLNLNALWVDLDRGLLSDNIGQQCESIVKLTELFDKFQLPVVVNSGFLRLARVFQNENNYIKLQIIRVIEKNHKHLQKILNIEEISKLIFYNIHSNDAVCRALTLRALGNISCIISDKHNVQHSIRLALESHDEMEAKEAIFAADKFCSVSNSFATSLFDRISEIIEDVQSPLDRKMKLIPLFVHMHHSTILSAKAKNLCEVMFYSYPRGDISKIILNVLTQLACKSLTNIHETITFFIKLLHEEPREKLHLFLLKNLHILAKKVSHLWTIYNLNSFIAYTNDQTENELLLLKASEILCTLAKNSNIFFVFVFNLSSDNRCQVHINQMVDVSSDDINQMNVINSNLFQNLIEQTIFHDNQEISFNFCLLSTTLLLLQAHNLNNQNFHSSNNKSTQISTADNIRNLFEKTKNALFSIILECDDSIDKLITNCSRNIIDSKEKENKLQNYKKFLKNSLKCTIDLVKMNDQSYINQLHKFISSLLNSIGSQMANFYCETLLTLCRFEISYNRIINNEEIEHENNNNQSENQEMQQKFISTVFFKLIEQENSKIDFKLQLKLLNLLLELQVRKSDFFLNNSDQSAHQNGYVERSIQKFLEKSNKSSWNIFKIGRMCIRYTYYGLAQQIYEMMSKKALNNSVNISISDLSYKSWFDFMALLSNAESLLSSKSIPSTSNNISLFINSLNQALSFYVKAQILFKSSCTRCLTPNSAAVPTLESSNTCFQIRYCELRSEQIKLYIHLILSTMTFHTIPSPVFQFKSSDSITKFGRIAQQMKYIIVELQKLNQKYKEFTSECFDADQHTINILNMCKKQIECLIFCINLLSSPRTEQVVREEYFANFLNNDKKSVKMVASIMNENDFRLGELIEYPAELKMSKSFYLNLFEKIKELINQDNKFQQTRIKTFQEILIAFIIFPITLPRAFFTSLQKTQIKLIVNPNTKKTNTIHAIRNDQTLVVKIDGIINQQLKIKKPIRTIKKVQISLTTEYDSKSVLEPKFTPMKYTDVKTSTEIPKNDYFNSNLLIFFPYCGNYIIQVDLNILDDNDVVWRYVGEKHQILVKVEEDPNRQKLFAALAAAVATQSTSTNLIQQQRLTPIPQLDLQDTQKMET